MIILKFMHSISWSLLKNVIYDSSHNLSIFILKISYILKVIEVYVIDFIWCAWKFVDTHDKFSGEKR